MNRNHFYRIYSVRHCSEHLTGINLLSSPQSPMRWVLSYSHFEDGDIEAQRSEKTCIRSHSRSVAALEVKPRECGSFLSKATGQDCEGREGKAKVSVPAGTAQAAGAEGPAPAHWPGWGPEPQKPGRVLSHQHSTWHCQPLTAFVVGGHAASACMLPVMRGSLPPGSLCPPCSALPESSSSSPCESNAHWSIAL